MKKYEENVMKKCPPHVYNIASQARKQLKLSKSSQAIILCGDSGSGKTESMKHMISFLCNSSEIIRNKIINQNPVIEALGNAPTVHNKNSSRFIKLLKVKKFKR